MDSKNNQNEINIGVDTGKTQLDIYIRPLDIFFTVSNDEAGIKKAITEIKKHKPTRIIIEATGRLEHSFIMACSKASLAIIVANPVHIKKFAGAIGRLAKTDKFNIRVGAYPHKHPEASSSEQDILWLKRKLDAGAKEAITQFFFEADDFFRFRDACVKAGIQAPIIPGILPIENWIGTRKFAQKCGAKIPLWLDEAFTKAERDGRNDLLATAVCSELCSDLIEGGVDALHFYTLNRPELTRDICFSLGIFPAATLEKVA